MAIMYKGEKIQGLFYKNKKISGLWYQGKKIFSSSLKAGTPIVDSTNFIYVADNLSGFSPAKVSGCSVVQTPINIGIDLSKLKTGIEIQFSRTLQWNNMSGKYAVNNSLVKEETQGTTNYSFAPTSPVKITKEQIAQGGMIPFTTNTATSGLNTVNIFKLGLTVNLAANTIAFTSEQQGSGTQYAPNTTTILTVSGNWGFLIIDSITAY